MTVKRRAAPAVQEKKQQPVTEGRPGSHPGTIIRNH